MELWRFGVLAVICTRKTLKLRHSSEVSNSGLYADPNRLFSERMPWPNLCPASAFCRKCQSAETRNQKYEGNAKLDMVMEEAASSKAAYVGIFCLNICLIVF